MDLEKACLKANIPVEAGRTNNEWLRYKNETRIKRTFFFAFDQREIEKNGLNLDFYREVCRGLSTDPITILLSTLVLPQFYNELKKIPNYLEILAEISKLEERSPKSWTLKNLKTELITEKLVLDKVNKLGENESLKGMYDMTIDSNKNFSLIQDGKTIKTKPGLFLGAVMKREDKIIWKWISAIGDIPPIDYELIIPLLPDFFVRPEIELDNEQLTILVSICISYI